MITIKGLREGLLIILGDGTWHEQLRELEAKLAVSANFFKGGRVALDVKAMALNRDDIERAKSLLTSFEVQLWAILSQNPETIRNAAAKNTFAASTPPPSASTAPGTSIAPVPGETAAAATTQQATPPAAPAPAMEEIVNVDPAFEMAL